MSKYGAKPTTVDGIKFASLAEARRYRELKLLERAGEITALECHPRFVIWQHGKEVIRYEGDFSYADHGAVVVEDVKGVQTAVFRMKAKMFRAIHPEIELRIVGAK
jgi:hypothetical protein